MLWTKVIDQNPWWKGKFFIDNDKEIAKYKKSLIKLKKDTNKLQGKIILIKGPRRVGKTTLMKLMIKDLLDKDSLEKVSAENVLYLNLDSLPSGKPKELSHVIDRFLFDLRENKGNIFLDEIITIEKWDNLLKGYADRDAFRNVNLVCTGSDPEKIETGKRTFLGRNASLYLMPPVSFRTFLLNVLNSQKISSLCGKKPEVEALTKVLSSLAINLRMPPKRLFEKYKKLEPYFSLIQFLFEKFFLRSGGFPRSINSFMEDFTDNPNKALSAIEIDISLYQNLIESILEKVENISLAKRLLTLLASENYLSSTLSYHSLAKKLSIHPSTAEGYFKKMENLLLLNEFRNMSEGSLKKIYFSDPFIFYSSYAMNKELNPNKIVKEFLMDESNSGKMVESVVANALFQHGYFPSLQENFLSFYRKNGKELDFIYFNRLGIEVKYRREIEAPLKIAEIKEYILLTRMPQVKPLEKNVLALPVSIFLALLEGGKVMI